MSNRSNVLIQEQIFFKHRSMFTNLKVSMWSERFSMEEGYALGLDYDGFAQYDNPRALSKMSRNLCKPRLLNGNICRFNKP